MWVNRTLCDVLDEMRKCHETHNYSYLLGLIEEAQSLGNRMEASLSDIKEIVLVQDKWHECKDKDKAMQLLEEHKEKKSKIGFHKDEDE